MSLTNQLTPPQLPPHCPGISTDGLSLRKNRDYMTEMPPDINTRDAILNLFDAWVKKPDIAEPLATVRAILNTMRILPRSEERLCVMNTFVRTLGQPELFATFLDMIRYSSLKGNTSEKSLSEISRKSSKHAVYGWCGQTRLSLSGTEPTSGTTQPEPGVQAFLGKTPTSAWSLSMHIWQPNPKAKGFVCGHRDLPGIIAEPPHSHPFDFASMVVTGQMHQSIYTQHDTSYDLNNNKFPTGKGRYHNIDLDHVHGVWPPHDIQEKSKLRTLEERVELNAGDSYYMSGDMLHDVQINSAIAQHQPAITLFLRAESFIKPHVYMAASMAEFHTANPELKTQGYPLAENDWYQKLEVVADYVRGKNTTLNLADIVRYDNDYAFFHT
ncbi:MAG: hypothetical protein DI538_06185 [Azospira oryzae]|nr:MAG: hypothetical protein DI538_06185 [Azospira oryzae]